MLDFPLNITIHFKWEILDITFLDQIALFGANLTAIYVQH